MGASGLGRAGGLVLLLVGACSELPGETLGTYKVTMTLKENTCGEAAVFSLDKKRYSVELRSDAQDHAYWRIPGQTPIQGRYDAPDFEFEFRAVVASAGPDAGPNGCRLVQSDQVSGSLVTHGSAPTEDELDAGEDAASEDQGELDAEVEQDADEGTADASADAGVTLEGEHKMTIAAEPGTDCTRDALMPAGAFERLPCSVRYQLRGLPTKPF